MPVKVVNADILRSWMDKDEVVLIDVREPAEHRAEKIRNAHSIPSGVISRVSLPNCDGKKLVLHCRAGIRSVDACKKLAAECPELDIYTLEGGISAWKALGCEVISAGKYILPIDRQVQLIIGALLLSSGACGFLLSPRWFAVSCIIGVGLTIAGLTGFCGLALIMAKVPWNK